MITAVSGMPGGGKHSRFPDSGLYPCREWHNFLSSEAAATGRCVIMSLIQSRSVLVLDDEKPYLDMMTELLSEHLVCPVVPFTHPNEALAALPQLEPGMVVTDFSMTEMNGIDFLYRAHAVYPRLNAIMITGHQIELGWQDLSHIPGLRAILFKPVSWRELASQIIQNWPDKNPPALKTDSPGATPTGNPVS
jgi:DNA-binding NtrC family response regulator